MPTFLCWFPLFKWSTRQYFDISRNFHRYESPDESCYSESVSVGDVARQKKRRRRKADVEASSKVGTMLTMMMARCWWSRGGGKVESLKKIFTSSFQGKLHHLDVGAGGELRLLGKHGPKSAGGLCRQFEVLVHTLGQLYYYSLKNARKQQTWPCYFFNLALLI